MENQELRCSRSHNSVREGELSLTPDSNVSFYFLRLFEYRLLGFQLYIHEEDRSFLGGADSMDDEDYS